MKCLLMLLALCAAPAWALSPEAQALLDRAAAECASFENGVFEAGEAVQEFSLRNYMGDLEVEVIDESAFACSSAASLYCGSGGCLLNVVAEGTVTSWQATGWQIVSWGPNDILLLSRDGAWCDGSGAEVCYEAVVWSDGRPLTVGPPPETR